MDQNSLPGWRDNSGCLEYKYTRAGSRIVFKACADGMLIKSVDAAVGDKEAQDYIAILNNGGWLPLE
jgi:hypothetical protein